MQALEDQAQAAPGGYSGIGAAQREITDALARLRVLLEAHIARVQKDAPDNAPADAPTPERLATLAALFGLTPFERDLLLLCAGVELDSSFAALCVRAQGEGAGTLPTFSLALAALPEAHWSALTPDAPLRFWHLLELGSGDALTQRPLAIDERILHYLAGVGARDARLAGIVEPAPPLPENALAPSHRALAEQIAAVWSWSAQSAGPFPAIQLFGVEGPEKAAIAQAACASLGYGLSVAAPETLPTNPIERDLLLRLWEREALLERRALLLDGDETLVDPTDTARVGAIARFIERVRGLLIVAGRERRSSRARPMVTYEVRKPTRREQVALWEGALGAERAQGIDGHIERLTTHFDIGSRTIAASGAEALGRIARGQAGSGDLGAALWDACREQARPRLDNLAQRIGSSRGWDDLVLPDVQKDVLRDIAAHVRQRLTVYEKWGFGGKDERGLGISALFAGVSGTGKTLAAEVLGNELRLDVYRIDLSAVVSKYIGETEKNLSRIFEAAEEGGAILLFDEADALFGKRSEVKDSHDRYANIEVSYLLQRMESYHGLAILTTNLKNSIDDAFLRRIRFVVPFPFPDAVQRARIWQRIFPADTPTESLETEKLSRLNVAGGNIRNIALNAAFLAADSGEPVKMAHILRAAHTEYAKLEKTLTAAETAGWVQRNGQH